MNESSEVEEFEIPETCSRVELSGLGKEYADRMNVIGTLATFLNGQAEVEWTGDNFKIVIGRTAPTEKLSERAKQFLIDMKNIPGCEIVFY